MNHSLFQPCLSNDLFEAFWGHWRVSRSIWDRRGMCHVAFEGEATIGANRFEEQGETLINGHRSRSSRVYGICLAETVAAVEFADGREFIRIGASPSQRLTHLCGDDCYQGRLMFRSRTRWAEAWHVTGPRKSYRSIATYLKL